MKSELPKVMHPIAGRPMIHYPVRAALEAGADDVIVVVGHGKELVIAYLKKAFGDRVRTAVQTEQKGTGDAAKAALAVAHANFETALIFYGDVPLVEASDLRAVIDGAKNADLAVATCELENPAGYGRVLRDEKGRAVSIREEKDLASDKERAVREINPGIYAVRADLLRATLAELTPNNAQKEYYLTDVVSLSAAKNKTIVTIPSRELVLEGVNDREQLSQAEKKMESAIRTRLRKSGITIHGDPRIEDGVTVEPGATIESGVVLRGETRVGKNTFVDVGCVLTNATVAEATILKPYSIITDSIVGSRAQIGPFSHLRPETTIGDEAHVGNFVETKKTRIAEGAKANHLAYLGDGIIGKNANVGAGTIFCNYDGFMKHTTTIEEGAFIGSDSQLVAPVTIGKGAYVGTGTTVTRDVPENGLALSRVPQVIKEGYAERLRMRLRAAKEALKKST